MPFEPAILLIIEGASVLFFLLFIPFAIAVSHVPQTFRINRGMGVLLVVLIVWTLVMYGLLIGTFTGLVYSGSQVE